MEIYLVGGAVRDELLGFPHTENDWVVVGASHEQMLSLGYQSVGKDFPVYLHPKTKDEYALARQERKTRAGYTGFEFETDSTISLEDDLLRRDLTINAIAKSSEGQIIDPYNGKADIEARLLRHVSPAFVEDPVRILRVARFMARYHHLGFSVAEETMSLMRDIVDAGEINHLVAERIWKEFSRALSEQSPSAFIQCLRDCGALKVLMPELDALFGVPQPEKHHPEIDTGVHVLMVLDAATKLSDDPETRFAALMHDLGKALTPKHTLPSHHGHEDAGLPSLAQLCDRIKAPNEFRELAEQVMKFHTHCHRAFELKHTSVLSLLQNVDAKRRPERFEKFLTACKSDSQGRTGFETRNYPQSNYLRYAFELTQGIGSKGLIEEGFSGQALGEEIRKRQLVCLKELRTAIQASLPKTESLA